jgi:hypothetical protein
MPTAHHICRLANPEDIRTSEVLWRQDRPLFDADVWEALPSLLDVLLREGLVKLAYIEAVPSLEPKMLGGISFIEPEYVNEARRTASTLPNTVFRAVLENRTPFLTPRQIGRRNAQGQLHLMNFMGNIRAIDLRDSELANFYEVCNLGYHFLHFGYSYRAMWAEVWPPHHVQELQDLGMGIDRELKLPGGQTSMLLCLTREAALANPYARRSSYFFPPAPLFQFSGGEQSMLELTLLDLSDDEIAEKLNVSKDAIKKRWRSVHCKVEAENPYLLARVQSATGLRKALLSYLRIHLEELRPFSR